MAACDTEQLAAAIRGLAGNLTLGGVRLATAPGIGRYRVEQLRVGSDGFRSLIQRSERVAGAEESQPPPARVRRRVDCVGEPLERRRVLPALAREASELVCRFACLLALRSLRSRLRQWARAVVLPCLLQQSHLRQQALGGALHGARNALVSGERFAAIADHLADLGQP